MAQAAQRLGHEPTSTDPPISEVENTQVQQSAMSVPARPRTGTWRVQARQTADSQQAWTAGVRTSAVSLALQASFALIAAALYALAA